VGWQRFRQCVDTVRAINDLLREVMTLDPIWEENMLRVVLVDRSGIIWPELSESLRRYAQRQLSRRRVKIRSNTAVTSYNAKEVVLDDGTTIPTRMFI
jgi:NADH dehydrogenase FAD-containing subunit